MSWKAKDKKKRREGREGGRETGREGKKGTFVSLTLAENIYKFF